MLTANKSTLFIVYYFPKTSHVCKKTLAKNGLFTELFQKWMLPQIPSTTM